MRERPEQGHIAMHAVSRDPALARRVKVLLPPLAGRQSAPRRTVTTQLAFWDRHSRQPTPSLPPLALLCRFCTAQACLVSRATSLRKVSDCCLKPAGPARLRTRGLSTRSLYSPPRMRPSINDIFWTIHLLFPPRSSASSKRQAQRRVLMKALRVADEWRANGATAGRRV